MLSAVQGGLPTGSRTERLPVRSGLQIKVTSPAALARRTGALDVEVLRIGGILPFRSLLPERVDLGRHRLRPVLRRGERIEKSPVEAGAGPVDLQMFASSVLFATKVLQLLPHLVLEPLILEPQRADAVVGGGPERPVRRG